jgi:predicted PurR-regulated permease PerM
MIQSNSSSPVRTAIEIAVYLLLIFAIVVWCLQIISPFVSFLVWGTIIAVAAYKPFLKLRAALGERKKPAVFIFAVIGLSVFLVPAWMFAGSVIESGQELKTSLESGQVHVPPPNESVKDWPLVGKKLYQAWDAASTNLGAFAQRHNEQLRGIGERVFRGIAGAGLSILQLAAATLIASALLANDVAVTAAMHRFFTRLVGDRGEEMLKLTTATIRSITVGVLGIAFIQAVLGGIGMVMIGIPAAGLWALFILILAIAQLPPLLVLLPAIVYVFSAGDNTTAAIIFTVWSIIVSFSDAVLKPIFLGRGVEAPMLVILLGAIGGMMHSGIVGLFTGAVILALGYKLFEMWITSDAEDNEEAAGDVNSEAAE